MLHVSPSWNPVRGGLEFIVFKDGGYQSPVGIFAAPEMDRFFKEYQEEKSKAQTALKDAVCFDARSME